MSLLVQTLAARRMSVVLLLTLGLFAAPPASAATLSIVPSAQTGDVGTLFAVDLTISGLGEGTEPSLGVYDIDLTFDPVILSFVEVHWGTALDLSGFGSFRTATPAFGLLNLFELSFDPVATLNALQPAEFVLATIVFAGIGIGQSELQATINALGDAAGAPLSADLTPGSISVGVAAIPEPASIVLLVSGVSIMGARRLRHIRRG
jgi:hypothetical protein